MQSSVDQASPALEVLDPEGNRSRLALHGPRMIIGRSSTAQVRLDGQSVSRQHAELYKDPFNRWWVRDLGSRNGTWVNGVNVKESLVSAGDVIQIEQFTLTILAGPSSTRTEPSRHTTINATITDPNVGPIRQLSEFRAPQISSEHLAQLTAFNARLSGTPNRDARLAALCQLMVSSKFHGRSALTLRVNRDLSNLAQLDLLCAPHWRDGENGKMPYVSQTTLRSLVRTGAGVVASTAPHSPEVLEISLAGRRDPSSDSNAAVACPIGGDDRAFDVLYVSFPPEFGTSEWLSLAALAAEGFIQSETAWAAREQAQAHAQVERELERAREIQMRLVPTDLRIPGIDAALRFSPCRWVGGDYVDVVPAGDDRVVVAVADVCGKGLQAALISSSLHSMIHTNVEPGLDVARLMERINNYLCAALPEDSFVTMIVAALHLKTGELECVNAGHPPGTIVTPTGTTRHLQVAANPPLGIAPMELECQRTVLEPDHLLALYTDGLTELVSEDDRMLGIDGLDRFVREAASGEHRAAAQTADRLEQLLNAHQGQAIAQDDRTFLLVRRV